MLRLNNSCCECNPQICLGLRVRRVCAACGQTMAIFHSELPCPILFLISQLKRTTILRPLSPPFARYELEANFYQFSKTSTQEIPPTKFLPSFSLLLRGKCGIELFETKKNLRLFRTKQILGIRKGREKVSAFAPRTFFRPFRATVSRRIAHAYILIRGCSCYKL